MTANGSRLAAAAVKSEGGAAKPGLVQEAARLVSEPLANSITGDERQRVESAQLDILDAALTLGTGAAYTREQLQGYRKSYFPQIGDGAAAGKVFCGDMAQAWCSSAGGAVTVQVIYGSN